MDVRRSMLNPTLRRVGGFDDDDDFLKLRRENMACIGEIA